jgi:branched-subunit amino acid transport protein AzlD
MTYFVLVCLVMGLVTYFTRALPFLFFSARKPPELMDFLQKYLPAVVMAILVFSMYKDIDFSAAPYGIPALVAGAITALLHLWKRNVLLSIGAGTAVYMIFIRMI